jgi:lipopolysaccharide biosynthesis glycosyltransferase
MSATTSDPLAVIVATDEEYGLPTATMAASLAASADPGRVIDLYVSNGGLTTSTAERLRRSLLVTAGRARERGVDFRPVLLSPDVSTVDGLKTHAHISSSAYLRLLIPDLLPLDVKRALYLDVDVIVRRDVGELFQLDLDGAPAAAAPNVTKSTIGANMAHHVERELDPNATYVNSGVMLLDLDQWRDDQIGKAVLDDLRMHQHLYQFHDQCGLNAVLQNRWAPLPVEWNVQVGSPVVQAAPPALSDVPLLHFTSNRKPWHTHYLTAFRERSTYSSYRKLWFDYSRISGWHDGVVNWCKYRIEISVVEARRKVGRKLRVLKARS